MSLLTGISPDLVVRHPFPHLVVQDALDPELCDTLAREFPPLESFVKGRDLKENKKIVRRATDLLADTALSPAWRSMIQEHLRPEVFEEWVRLFGAELQREHPGFEEAFGDPALMRVGTRGLTEEGVHDVALDAALVAHTPAISGPGAERGPHLKEPNKPFLAFLFLPPDEEDAQGAELEIYQVKEGSAVQFYERNQTALEHLEVAHRVPYRRNTLVLMLNTPRSITTHAVRGPSQVPVRYFHILAELPRPMFAMTVAGA
jgi:hypothetical protein